MRPLIPAPPPHWNVFKPKTKQNPKERNKQKQNDWQGSYNNWRLWVYGRLIGELHVFSNYTDTYIYICRICMWSIAVTAWKFGDGGRQLGRWCSLLVSILDFPAENMAGSPGTGKFYLPTQLQEDTFSYYRPVYRACRMERTHSMIVPDRRRWTSYTWNGLCVGRLDSRRLS